MSWLVSLACGWLLVSCGGTSTGSGGAGGDGGGGGGGTSSRCGSTPPASGDACKSQPSAAISGSVADCSWGDDPRPQCRIHAVCQNDVWSVKQPDDSCQAAPKPAACPAKPAAAGTQCSDAALQCWYDDGTVCSCSACSGGSPYPICQTIDPPEWACSKPAEGCPNPAPQAGSDCTDSGLSCGVSCELPIRCENGAWQYGGAQCPICAAPDTPIATPFGDRAIATLRVGDLVYSVDHGAIVAVPIARIGSTPVAHHTVLRLVVSGGAVLHISPGHPTASGEPLSALVPGQAIDGAHMLVESEREAYAYARTYDILPASSTGSYFAAGVQLGSTLASPR